jgi:GNAT superfamily N-acetyltransferase
MKIVNSIKFDGWINTLQNILTLLKKRSYGKSCTALLQADINDLLMVERSAAVNIEQVHEYKKSNLLNLNNIRIKIWLDNGAHLYLAMCDGAVVGYTFIHLKKYKVDGVGIIDLEKDKSLWIGPTFVDKAYRSQGINKQLINISAKNYAGERNIALTSANINNINSIKSFIRNGFKLKDIFICTYTFGRQKLIRLIGNE